MTATVVKIVLWAGWVLFIAIGLIILVRPKEPAPPAQVFIAATDLPQNTLLRKNNAGFNDRYVTASVIKAGTPIQATDVGTFPIAVVAPTAKLLLDIPVDAHGPTDTPGAVRQLCNSAAEPLANVTVQYVRCSSTSSCSVTVSVPLETAGKLASDFNTPEAVTKLRLAPSCKQ